MENQSQNPTQTVTKNNQVVTITSVTCKNCGSNAVVKFGTYKGNQRYYCKVCHRKFKADSGLFHMKTQSEQVSSALMMYYSGSSVKDIRTFLKQQYGSEPSKSTLFGWIDKYSNEAVKIANQYHPKISNTLIADETVLRCAGQNIWMYDIIDRDTRFLLATRFALSRTSHNAEMLMKEASQRAGGQIPKVIITDANSSYPDGIEMAFGSEAEHIQSRPFAKVDDTQRIERWHETLKERTKIMKGLKTLDSGMRFIDGFLVYYNYFRPNEALDGKTPAEEAGIKFPYKNWAEIIRQPVSKEAEIKTHITPHIHLPPKPRIKLPETHVGKPRTHVRPSRAKGDMYVGRGMVSRHSFKGGKARRGRII